MWFLLASRSDSGVRRALHLYGGHRPMSLVGLRCETGAT